MGEISNEKKIETIVKALDSKRAEDIQVIGIKDLTIIADYFVIANGDSNTQTKALAEEVEYKMEDNFGLKPIRTEGYQTAQWIVLDYGDIVVHVFYKETRHFYNLEKLWSDGKPIDISQYVTGD